MRKGCFILNKKNPLFHTGRGKRQVEASEGSMVAGYKLAKVNAESILLVHGEDKIIVTLNTEKDQESPKKRQRKANRRSCVGLTSRQIPPSSQPPASPMRPNMPNMPPMQPTMQPQSKADAAFYVSVTANAANACTSNAQFRWRTPINHSKVSQ